MAMYSRSAFQNSSMDFRNLNLNSNNNKNMGHYLLTVGSDFGMQSKRIKVKNRNLNNNKNLSRYLLGLPQILECRVLFAATNSQYICQVSLMAVSVKMCLIH